VEKIVEQVQTVGCVICGQTDTMVPADKLLYALRDVTATVPSIPLITASILSKKLAESLDALILDVKFGCAAFMQTKDQARELAQSMVTLGKECGVNTRAVLNNMDIPTGRAAGNWLEVKEAVECLRFKAETSVSELVVELAGELLNQTGRVEIAQQGVFPLAIKEMQSGRALAKWEQMLAAQGTDMQLYEQKLAQDTTAPVVLELKAPQSAIIGACNARISGEIVRDLGGGRLTKESAINHDVGIDQMKKPGEAVHAGDLLARVHAATHDEANAAMTRLKSAFTFSDEPPVLYVPNCEVIT
jgi:pyrimidine-nucleoside phosphorylase